MKKLSKENCNAQTRCVHVGTSVRMRACRVSGTDSTWRCGIQKRKLMPNRKMVQAPLKCIVAGNSCLGGRNIVPMGVCSVEKRKARIDHAANKRTNLLPNNE